MVTLVESLSEERDLRIASPLILAGHLNVALCYLKLGKYPECIESCDKVRENRCIFWCLGPWGKSPALVVEDSRSTIAPQGTAYKN